MVQDQDSGLVLNHDRQVTYETNEKSLSKLDKNHVLWVASWQLAGSTWN